MVADFLSRLNNEGEFVLVEDGFLDEKICVVSINSPWFGNIVNYLSTGRILTHLSPTKKKIIIKLSASYSWIQHDFFYIGPDLVIHKYVWEDDTFDILRGCRDEPCGINYVAKRITYKIIHMGYYWPTLFKGH